MGSEMCIRDREKFAVIIPSQEGNEEWYQCHREHFKERQELLLDLRICLLIARLSPPPPPPKVTDLPTVTSSACSAHRSTIVFCCFWHVGQSQSVGVTLESKPTHPSWYQFSHSVHSTSVPLSSASLYAFSQTQKRTPSQSESSILTVTTGFGRPH